MICTRRHSFPPRQLFRKDSLPSEGRWASGETSSSSIPGEHRPARLGGIGVAGDIVSPLTQANLESHISMRPLSQKSKRHVIDSFVISQKIALKLEAELQQRRQSEIQTLFSQDSGSTEEQAPPVRNSNPGPRSDIQNQLDRVEITHDNGVLANNGRQTKPKKMHKWLKIFSEWLQPNAVADCVHIDTEEVNIRQQNTNNPSMGIKKSRRVSWSPRTLLEQMKQEIGAGRNIEPRGESVIFPGNEPPSARDVRVPMALQIRTLPTLGTNPGQSLSRNGISDGIISRPTQYQTQSCRASMVDTSTHPNDRYGYGGRFTPRVASIKEDEFMAFKYPKLGHIHP